MWIQINTDDETIIIPNVRRYCKVSTTVTTAVTQKQQKNTKNYGGPRRPAMQAGHSSLLHDATADRSFRK